MGVCVCSLRTGQTSVSGIRWPPALTQQGRRTTPFHTKTTVWPLLCNNSCVNDFDVDDVDKVNDLYEMYVM